MQNAKLVRTAPELLAACEKFVAFIGRQCESMPDTQLDFDLAMALCDAMKTAREAIQKATGAQS